MATKDYTEYVNKDLTDMQARMIEWLQGEEVGADATACKNKQEAFELGVKLGVALRIQFQKSDFNQEARSTAADEREQAKAKKAETKKASKKTAAAEEADEDEAEEQEEEAPKPVKKAGKKAAAKKPAAKKPAKKAAATADEDDEDDEF